MRIKLTYIAPLLAAGAAAVAIAAAPTAAAAKCAELLGKNLPVARQCSDQRRPSPVQFHPYGGDMPFLPGGDGGIRGGMR